MTNMAKSGKMWQNVAKSGKMWQNGAKWGKIWQNVAKCAKCDNLLEFNKRVHLSLYTNYCL